MTDSFRLDVREGIRRAAELGADGLQVYAVRGEVCPEAMDASKRREFRAFCGGLGLEISALCGDLGGHGFTRLADNPPKISRSKAIVDLAVDLGTAVVTTHIGVVPADRSSGVYGTLRAACRELGEYARSRGVTFAVETGPETARQLAAFLRDVDSRGIGANLDPANLVMVTGDDPVKAVDTLREYIVHTHAKDGVKLAPCDPQEVYDAYAEGRQDELGVDSFYREVPLGEGQVDFDGYLRALERIGYRGYLTIEREVGENPERDIAAAVAFLKGKLGRR